MPKFLDVFPNRVGEWSISATTRKMAIMLNMRKIWWAMLVLAAFTGCGEEPAGDNPPPGPATGPAASKPAEGADAAKPEAPKGEEPKEAPKDEKKADAKAELSADEVAEIEKLPGEDKVIAIKQIVCPVSGSNLGSMGVPVKVTAEGQSFLLCCKSCQDDVKKDPKAVVAKLTKK